MLMFSLVIQPMICEINEKCKKLLISRWYADNWTLCGPISEVKIALDIIATAGKEVNFILEPTKSKAYWSVMRADKLKVVTDAYPLIILGASEGMKLLGASLGSETNVEKFLLNKFAKVDSILSTLATVHASRTTCRYKLCPSTS